ncbi:hypothetical protein ANANG_G00136810 [Anguilla anguilla]|uniref:FH2 domain-containing protein n=1 Tax=Anguilla anguilla TaxID=7936 RepID=A0A9D3MA23_ANGAN|nr:hypothetical protein ANANG_G00136810 [Anguilla anguilla]
MNSPSLANEKQNCNGGSRAADSMPAPQPPPVSVLCGPPAPAPPPLPPPPPPPPPSLPRPHRPSTGSGNPVPGQRKKKRVRSFFWKTIPEEKVRAKPNIWTLATRQQQQYQIDVRTIEELFGQQEEARSSGGLSRGDRSKDSIKETKKEICILDSKRGMNVGIFLKQFRKSNQAIVEAIRFGKSAPFGPEPLRDLLKLLPDEDEVRARPFLAAGAECSLFLHLSEEAPSVPGRRRLLSLADSFVYLLIQVPSFDLRIEAMVLKEEFVPLSSVMSKEIDIMRTAMKELMSCEELHAILHLVLQAGNIMNAGGYAGNAVGFKLSSLLSLADTKANKPGMNLLHFVALEAQKKDKHLLKFPEKLVHVQSAARMSLESVEAEFQSLHSRTQSVEAKVQKDGELKLQLDEFLQSWSRVLEDLKKRRTDLRQEGNALIDFFCEDKDTVKLDDCFRIFQDFCLKFKKAVQDNWERELKEATKQRRLRELEEKRHSWAGNADQGGGFGRSSSENDVETLTREGLLDFLQQRPRAPTARRAARPAPAATGAPPPPPPPTASCAASWSSPPMPTATPTGGSSAWPAPPAPGQGHPGLAAEGSEAPPTLRVGPDRRVDGDSRSAFSRPSFVIGDDLERNVFLKAAAGGRGQMNVSVEKHTLVPRLQPFDFVAPGNDGNNNARSADRGDVVVTDLETLDSPPSGTGSGPSRGSTAGRDDKTDTSTGPEQEGSSTSSSMAHNPPPALDPSVSNKQPAPHFLDCTDTDCSVILDYSETDSPVSRGGTAADMRTLVNDSRSNLNAQNSASSVLPLEDQKARKAPQAGDQTPRGPSFRKPAVKPGRTAPRPPPEEKMCRSTMRALALAQAAAAPAHARPRPQGRPPGFARNTVASSSRWMKKDSGPSSTPSSPSKTAALARTGSLRHAPNRVAPAGGQLAPGDGETTQGPLRRSPSARGYSRTVSPSETPPSPRDHSRKFSSGLSDKSVHSKDSASSNTLKPTWK